MPQPMSADAIARELAALPDWKLDDGEIVRTFDCGNFNGSIGFVNAVADAANAADHHPDIAVSWNSVTLRLSSHDAHGLTGRDFALARTIDGLAP
jgi:4a-hydroxytetrahydrobiopterin dehydratase